MGMILEDFLFRYSLSPECVNMEELCGYILSEMYKGLEGRQSSLAMIDSFCSPSADIPAGGNAAVIDAGGSNLRTCLVHFDNNLEPVIEDMRKTRMPGADGELTAGEFFEALADEAEAFIEKSSRVGFCFSYPAEIMPDMDGKVLGFNKEVKAPEVTGKLLGKELFACLSKRGHDMSLKRIAVMNDTTATLLAGLPLALRMNCRGCVGFILGTGTNTAFIGTKHIGTKCLGPKYIGTKYIGTKGPRRETIINEESGNLDLVLGDIDREFMGTTERPDRQHFEKMISGAYLGPLGLCAVRKAASLGLFSGKFCAALENIKTLGTPELSTFMEGGPSQFEFCRNTADEAVLLGIFKALTERAGKLAAANIAASVLITGYGTPDPVLINADGTTFWKTAGLRESTERYLDEFLEAKGRKAVITGIENSPVKGAAIGALSV